MNFRKLSASLATLIADYEQGGSALVMSAPRATPFSGTPMGTSPALRVFLHCNPAAKFGTMRRVKVHQGSGTIRTAQVPLDQIEKLADRADVHRIAAAQLLRPLMDVATAKMNVPSFQAASGLAGSGVVVGVVDTGIDVSHPALAGRVLSIWDQNIPGTGWGTTTYGSVLTGPAMTASRDLNGHGTHVAGIAAGADPVFTGIAPKAELVIVKTDFTNVGIADGVRYVFEEARKLGRPAVVNLSLGGHGDAHDGSDDLAAVIDAEVGPGRIVVAAAGNEGQSPIHGAATVAPGATVDLAFAVPSLTSGAAPEWVVLNGWYPGSAGLEIAIRTSSGSLTTPQPVISTGSPSRTTSFPNARIMVSTPPSTSTPNGDHQFRIEIQPGASGTVVQGGTWRLRVKNPGTSPVKLDVWSIVPPDAGDAAFLAPAVSPDLKIGSPGCAAGALTVAAYTTRNQWTDLGGSPRAVGLPLDDISDFSSPGPLRNGGQKPDLTAPGAMIVSCLSSSSSPRPTNVVAPGFLVEAGTSMASPFVAGIIALLLERAATLDPPAVKALLKANTTVPGRPAGTFDPSWGFGLIDASGL